nr:unnamed protein product [Spirometra erinaceieuropaei]
MKGLGTDEQAIIDILAYRSVSQRKDIAKAFKSSYGEDIYSKLHGELSGHFRDAVLMSFRDKAHVNAYSLYNAITGAGTKDRVVVQTICACDNEEIEELKKAYEDILKEKQQDPLKRNLEKDVEGDTSGDYKRVLIALLQGQREEKTAKANVVTDCEALYTAGEGKVGTDESVFVRILANRSHAHIREINKVYSAAMGHDLIKAIHKETSGNFKDALEIIVKTALNKTECIADMLLGSMKGMGTNDDDLIRLVLAYSEDNLEEVKKVFATKNEKSLADYIRGDTSGDYKSTAEDHQLPFRDIAVGQQMEKPAKEVRPCRINAFHSGDPPLRSRSLGAQMATVKPAANFDAAKDAEALRKAMKGLGTDEQAIIDILAYRSVDQRKEIAKVFKSSYGEDIYSKLRGELSGNFRDAVLLSFRDKAHVNAYSLYNAITGAGTNDRVVIQTICASNNEEIEELKKAYEDILKEKKQDPLKRNLEKDVEGDTSGDYKRVLIALLQGQREENTAKANVATDCEALYTAGEGKVGTDESVFVRILANRSHAHIREINKVYFASMEHDLIRAIHKETSGNFRDALETIVKTALNKADCIADMLLGSMKGLGTRDDDLIRLVLAYSEDNLEEVKQAFAAKNGKTLAEYIRGETSGDYKKFLLAIVGK